MEERRQHTNSSGSSLNRMELMNLIVIAGSLGLTLFVCIFIGVFLGRMIDDFFATSPWGIIIFSLLGTVSGFWSLYKKAIVYMNHQSAVQEKTSRTNSWKN